MFLAMNLLKDRMPCQKLSMAFPSFTDCCLFELAFGPSCKGSSFTMDLVLEIRIQNLSSLHCNVTSAQELRHNTETSPLKILLKSF